MSRTSLRLTTLVTAAVLALANGTASRAEMPADCPMHAQHQKEKAEREARAAGKVVPTSSTSAAVDHSAHTAAASTASTSAASPYAGFTGRAIAALSDEEIAALRAGTGHGLALPAEMRRYPGPRHLLDLAGELGLDAADRASLQASFDRMHARAVSLGERIVESEIELDRLFVTRKATNAEVERLTATIAALQGELRAAHLVAHVEAEALLDPHQIARYDALRGYGAAGAP